MATIQTGQAASDTVYPDSDGKPIAETPLHRQNMTDTIEVLEWWFGQDPQVYVSGNMLMYYVPGDRRRHVAPDVFVVRGIAKATGRRRYLVWEEGKAPDLVIELTSESTRNEDLKDKFRLYRDKLQVREYFLFDPYGEYLDPPLRGYCLADGAYRAIEPVNGRLPSAVLGLDLERAGTELRLYDQATRQRLKTASERALGAEVASAAAEAARAAAEAARAAAEEAASRAQAERDQEAAARRLAETEAERLRRELAALRQGR